MFLMAQWTLYGAACEVGSHVMTVSLTFSFPAQHILTTCVAVW